MKIAILTTRTIDSKILGKGMNIVGNECKSIGLSLEINQYPTTKLFSGIPFKDSLLSNPVKVDPQQIFDEAKQLRIPFDIVCLLYDWTKVFPQPTNPHEDGQIIQIPTQWYEGSVALPPERVLADFFEHELCHYFFSNIGRVDITHNQQLDLAWSNKEPHEWYIHLLSQFVSPTPTATIKRYSQNKETTGVLTAQKGNLSFSCKTLELPWKNNIVNISCIPVGTYEVKWTRSLKFPVGTYEVQNVSARSGIRIHPANFFYDLLGCIALGDSFIDLNKDGAPDVSNSQATINVFNTFFNKQSFILTIL